MLWNDASISFKVMFAFVAMQSRHMGRSRMREVMRAARSGIRFVTRSR